MAKRVHTLVDRQKASLALTFISSAVTRLQEAGDDIYFIIIFFLIALYVL